MFSPFPDIQKKYTCRAAIAVYCVCIVTPGVMPAIDTIMDRDPIIAEVVFFVTPGALFHIIDDSGADDDHYPEDET